MNRLPELLEYEIGSGVRAFSTTRRGGCSVGAYAEFNVNHYCGDDEEAIGRNREALCQALGISAAIQRIGSTPVAILGALEPVTAVAIAVLLFNEVLTLRLAIGMLLVILAVTLIIGGPTVSHHILRVRKMFPRRKL